MEANHIIITQSKKPVKEVIDQLEKSLTEKGATIYSRIDQQQEAAKYGIELPALEFMLFGNPKAGGKIMHENPIAALDLPLKVIAWENPVGQTNVAFNSPEFVRSRYDLDPEWVKPLDISPVIAQIL